MLGQNNMLQERRVQSTTLIQKLLESRQNMLSLYNEVAGRRSSRNDPDLPELVQEFCQSLVDYTAHAHFQLFQYFAENKERRREIIKVADDIYPQILDITQYTLSFNDKYDCGDHCNKFDNLGEDLSALGERIADRIELEDRLIEAFGGKRSAK